MASIPSIKTTVNAQIRTETAAGGITPGEVSDLMDSILNEVRDRGILWVADSTAVAAADPTDSKHVGDISTGIVYRHNGTSYVAILTPGSGGGGGATPLSTPTLTATVISSTQIDLSWTNVANESSYLLQRSPDNINWTTINSPAADATSYSNTGLTPSTLYYYRIKAVGDGITYSDSGYGTDSDTTSAAATKTYLTFASIPTGFSAINTNKGWASVSGAPFGAFQQTLAVNEQLVIRVNEVANTSMTIGLSDSGYDFASYTGMDYGMWQNTTLSFIDAGAAVNPQSSPITKYFKLKYVSGALTFHVSTDGITWGAAIATAAAAPAGTYTIGIKAFGTPCEFDLIYKETAD